MSDNSIELITQKSLFEKILVFWKTREVGYKTEQLLKILPVAIYADRQISPKELQKAKDILAEHIKDSEEIEALLDRIELTLVRYIKDYNEYLSDKQNVLEIITHDIQLYGVMKDIFNSDGNFDNEEKKMEFLVDREFNEKWEERKSHIK